MARRKRRDRQRHAWRECGLALAVVGLALLCAAVMYAVGAGL